jgi:glycosyltransferase involved in cell wall biosynthesis
MNDKRTRISIVMACRNEIGHIHALLNSLLAQDMSGISWEAIIADGMSTDRTREVLEDYCARHLNLRVIPNPGQIVSTGLNAAILEARGDIILRMDAHTSYSPTYSRQCMDTLLGKEAENVGGPARTRVKGVVQCAVAAAYHSRFSTGGSRFHDANYEGWVDTVPYGCWKKTTLERIGLFDETLVRNQDDELNLRLLRSGGKIWQNPNILSWYSPRSTILGLFRQYFQYGFWKVAVIRKHRLPGSWRHLVPAGFVIANIALLAAIPLAAVSASKPLVAMESVWLWLIMAVFYASASVIASVMAARKSGWKTLPFLPVVFAAYHFSYGMGFLMGLFRFASKPTWRVSNDSVFARITR